MTIHYLTNNWELKSLLIDIGSFEDNSATSTIIKGLWDYQLSKWKLNEKDLSGCTLDGGGNYQKASRSLQVFNLWCVCHWLDLVVKFSVKHKLVFTVCKKLKNC